VPVHPRRPLHRLRRVRGVHGVDPAAHDALLHQGAQVVPELAPAPLADLAALDGRRQAGPEQHLVGVDQPAAGHDALVEQQREQRPGAALDRPVGRIGIRVVPQRIGAQPGAQRGDLGVAEHLTGGRTAQVEPVPFADHPHPDLADRLRHGRPAVGEPAVESEVDVQAVAGVEVVQQVLAVRLGVDHGRPGEQPGAGGEPALRAGDLDPLPGEEFSMASGQAVDRMSLGHPPIMPTADSPKEERVAEQVTGARG
jgi:hypothetical protein